MKWLKRILLSLLELVLLIIAISFFLPKHAHIERSAVVNAQPAVVYGILNNLKSYDKWMPWNQLDPNWKVKYSDTTIGKGANYSWVSEKSDVGTGSLTIEDAKPNELVTTRLYFEGMGSSLAGWQIAPESTASKVKWYIDMDLFKGGFMSSVMGKWRALLA